MSATAETSKVVAHLVEVAICGFSLRETTYVHGTKDLAR